jgi:hypothetical protein
MHPDSSKAMLYGPRVLISLGVLTPLILEDDAPQPHAKGSPHTACKDLNGRCDADV